MHGLLHRAAQGVEANQLKAAVKVAQTGIAQALAHQLECQLSTVLRARPGIRNLALADKAIAVAHGDLEGLGPGLPVPPAHPHSVWAGWLKAHCGKVGHHIGLQVM